jgi:hypothetical protein
LGITVGTDDEMTPRVRLGSVPFAVQALTVPDGSITAAKLDLANGLTVTGNLTVTKDIYVGGALRGGAQSYWADYRAYVRFLKEAGVTNAALCPEGGSPVGVAAPTQSLSMHTGSDLAQRTSPESGTCVNVHEIAPCSSITGDYYPGQAQSCDTDFAGKWAPFYWWDGGPADASTYNILGSGDSCHSVKYACVQTATACPPNSTPPPSGMVSWWTGDGDANDIVGTHHGQAMNGVTFETGKVNQAFRFDGVDDFVQVDSFITSYSAFTFDFWVNIQSFTHDSYMTPFCQAPPEDAPSMSLFCFYTGSAPGSFGLLGKWNDGTDFGMRTDIPFGVGVWKHVAITYDGSHLRQYVDGQLLNEKGYASKTLGNTQPLLLGKGYAYPSNEVETFHFNGLLDEVEIFNRALSQAEIQAIFGAGEAGKCKPA